MYEKLIQTKNKLEELEDELKIKKAQFEEDTKFLKAKINDLADEEKILKTETITDMDNNGQDRVECEGKLIISATRVTRKIDNINDFFESLSDKKMIKEIEDYVDVEEVKESIVQEYVLKDKKIAENLFNEYEKLTGNLLPGVVENRTRYLTIKNKV